MAGWLRPCRSRPGIRCIRPPYDPDKQAWELYNVEKDFSQADNLATANPEKLRQMQDLWWVEAARYNVLPLDGRVSERFNSEAMGRPSLIAGRRKMEYYPGIIGLPDAASPPMLNKSWTITAEVEVPEGNANGMIVTQGGLEGGYGLYLRDGKPTFVYNYLALERPTFEGKNALPRGKTKIVVDFAYDGGGAGKGGKVTMTANGATVAEGRLERTVPVQFGLGEGLDIGMDVGSPIDFTYKLPFAFTGKVDKVTVELK
jgi:hypothetical protein